MRSFTNAAGITMITAAFLCLASLASPAGAAETEDFGPPSVIEKRAYLPHHEFRLAIAYLPQDPFYKAVGVDVAYTWHMGQYWSWEVARAAYFTTYDTDIRNALRNQFDKKKDPYEKAQYIVASNLEFAPFYGRYSIMNRGTLHQETYLAGGISAISWKAPEDGKHTGGGVRPAANAGLGFRFYTSHKTSLKLEVLENLFMRSDGSVGDQVWLTLGGSFSTQRK